MWARLPYSKDVLGIFKGGKENIMMTRGDNTFAKPVGKCTGNVFK